MYVAWSHSSSTSALWTGVPLAFRNMEFRWPSGRTEPEHLTRQVQPHWLRSKCVRTETQQTCLGAKRMWRSSFCDPVAERWSGYCGCATGSLRSAWAWSAGLAWLDVPWTKMRVQFLGKLSFVFFLLVFILARGTLSRLLCQCVRISTSSPKRGVSLFRNKLHNALWNKL